MTRGKDSEVEVYLVRRSEKLRFFGGYWALPGGVADEDDSGPSDEGDEGHASEIALARCAVRELFEETGVLISPERDNLSDAERKDMRSALLDAERGSSHPKPWRALADLHPDPSSQLYRIYRITTPPFAPMRYRTIYFQVELPEGEFPSIIEGELTEGQFWKIEEAMDAWARGELWIVPPLVFLFEHLRGRPLKEGLVDAGRAAAALEAGKLHPVRFTPGVIVMPLLAPTHLPATTTNCFIVGTDLAYVVDPAAVEVDEQARLFEAIDDRIRGGGDRLAGVIVTHHHPDHVGSVEVVSRRYSVPVFAHALTLSRLPSPPEDARVFEDGGSLDLGVSPRNQNERWKLIALHTPGHDRGHLAFVETAYRTLIAGDLVSTVSTIAIDPPEGHLQTYVGSLKRLLEEDISLIYPAHGLAQRNGTGLLRHYLTHRKIREGHLLECLTDEPKSLSDLLPLVYPEVAATARSLAKRSLLAGLIKLEEEGRASSTSGGHAWSRR